MHVSSLEKTKFKKVCIKGHYDEIKDTCTQFFVLKEVCVLIDSAGKKLQKHPNAISSQGYGCYPNNELYPSTVLIRTQYNWTGGYYEQLEAESADKPRGTSFYRSGK